VRCAKTGSSCGTDAQPGRFSSPRRAERRLGTWLSHHQLAADGTIALRECLPARTVGLGGGSLLSLGRKQQSGGHCCVGDRAAVTGAERRGRPQRGSGDPPARLCAFPRRAVACGSRARRLAPPPIPVQRCDRWLGRRARFFCLGFPAASPAPAFASWSPVPACTRCITAACPCTAPQPPSLRGSA